MSYGRNSRVSARLDHAREDPVLGLSDIGTYISSDGSAGPRIVENIQFVPPRMKMKEGRANLDSEREDGSDSRAWTLVEKFSRRGRNCATNPLGVPGRDLDLSASRPGFDLPVVERAREPRGGHSYAGRLRASLPSGDARGPGTMRDAPPLTPRRRPLRPAAVLIRPAPGGSIAEVLHVAKDSPFPSTILVLAIRD